MCVVAMVGTALALLIAKWPFSRAAMARELEGLGEGRVEIGELKTTYFPPGCVAKNVVFHGQSEKTKPPITVERLTVVGSYVGMFERPEHIRRIILEYLKVEKADGGRLTKPSRKSTLVVDELLANDAELTVAMPFEREPLKFQVQSLSVRELQAGKPFAFIAALRLPTPPAVVKVDGRAGPINDGDPDATPLSGSFVLKDADLAVFRGIGGKLSGQGKFSGQLGRLDVNGETSMPQFILKSTGHGLPLSTKFHAFVDGTNGDVQLEKVTATLGKTVIQSTGIVLKDGNPTGKTVSLRMSGKNGRIEDLLYLFVHHNSPIAGSTNFETTVELVPKPGKFVEKVVMDATFGIGDTKFTKTTTQQKVDELSERAQGDTKDGGHVEVVSDLGGHVRLENGVAHFSKLAIAVPGASADLRGTFNVETKDINLRGLLRTDVKLSDATTGFKAFVMKVIEFAKNKHKQGAVVPVRITGKYGKPAFKIDAPKEK